jgi:hypothetical protein
MPRRTLSGRVSGGARGSRSSPNFCGGFPRTLERAGKATRVAGHQRKPPYEGAFGIVDGGGACERASREAAIHGADARGGGSMETWADDNQRIMTSDSFLPIKPVIMQLSADPSESLTQAARTLKETKRLSSRSAPARSMPARHSESARKRPHTIVSRRIRRPSLPAGTPLSASLTPADAVYIR